MTSSAHSFGPEALLLGSGDFEVDGLTVGEGLGDTVVLVDGLGLPELLGDAPGEAVPPLPPDTAPQAHEASRSASTTRATSSARRTQ